MNDVFRLSAAVIFVNVTVVALFVVVGALFPRRVARARMVADSFPGRAFAVGLINLLFFLGVALAFSALVQWLDVHLFNLPALAILILLTVCIALGLAAVVQLVGERLAPPAGLVGRTVWGALALAWACATPLIGWFGLLPFVCTLGLGAFILSFFYPAKPAGPPAER